jgi:hypothetical protein
MADQLWSVSPPAGNAPDTRILGAGDTENRGEEACLSRAVPQLMFRLYFRDGRRRSLQYFNLVEQEYQSGMLRIYCHECTVTILGRQLREMDDKLAEHKVYAFVERHKNEFLAAESEPYIEKISLGPANLDALGRNPAG